MAHSVCFVDYPKLFCFAVLTIEGYFSNKVVVISFIEISNLKKLLTLRQSGGCLLTVALGIL